MAAALFAPAATLPELKFGHNAWYKLARDHRGCRNASLRGLGDAVARLSSNACGPCSKAISKPRDTRADFLVVMQHGRVGSTWLEALLNNHSGVTTLGADSARGNRNSRHLQDAGVDMPRRRVAATPRAAPWIFRGARPSGRRSTAFDKREEELAA